MSNAELIYAAVVLFVGVPAMLRNWTAAALVMSYVFMQGSYYGLGIVYPPLVCWLVDITVIILILAKQSAYDRWPYATRRAYIAAFWLELSYWDRLIIGLFPAGWIFYAFAENAWWPLWFISLAQLIAAGFEAFETFQIARAAKRVSVPDLPSSGFHFAPGRERGYG